MQAMILAAGFGTRLLPYTKIRPKPLFPLLNEPLLLLTVRRLQAAGFDRIIVNCHYLREQIVSALASIAGVYVQEEEIVLGTGGGLRMALPKLRNEPLLVTNGDIYHMVNYRELYSTHLENKGVVTMAMHDYPRFNKVSVSGGQVTGFEPAQSESCLAFTGLHVLEPEVLDMIPAAQEYSIIDCYRNLLREGKTISVMRVDGCSWTDMGTVDDYLDLHGKLLKREIPLWAEFSNIPETPFLIHDKARTDSGGVMKEWVSVGKARIEENVSLQRCVVWDDTKVVKNSNYTDVLLIPESEDGFPGSFSL